jgi:spermidine synthase
LGVITLYAVLLAIFTERLPAITKSINRHRHKSTPAPSVALNEHHVDSFIPNSSRSTSIHPTPTELFNIKFTSKMTDSNEAEITEHQRSKGAFKYVEDVAPGLKLEMDLNTIHHTSVSEFQEVQVIDSYFGKTLITDGKTQSSEHDEFVYHESLVHPGMFWSALLSSDKSGPKSVFIGGGGELATAREVLRHTSVERCVMVDIDPLVVNVCTKFLPEWGGEAVLKHPKMTYIVGDAHKYLMETTEKFDVIIMDISDPVEAGPGIALYTQEFYQRAAEVLNKENGVFVTQAGSADFVPHPHAFPEEGHGDEENKETCCFR